MGIRQNLWNKYCNLNLSISAVKKRSVIRTFFLHPLIPAFRISKLIFEKRYNKFVYTICYFQLHDKPNIPSNKDKIYFGTVE
jgi:hypothetical protein